MDASPSPSPGPLPPADNGQLEEWLRQARDGSRSALGRALEAGRPYLLLAARGALDDRLRSKVGSSDLVQETFVDAQRDFVQFRGETWDEFVAWLVGIMAHRLANNVRRYRLTKGRAIDLELPLEAVEAAMVRLGDEAATPGAAAIVREEQRRVQAALARMSEALRSVLVERTWQGLPFGEIGQRRGLSADAARKMWARAVREMHKLLLELE
jgi:RNA polymerase sigma-70 factor (ECF subfamily)